MAANCLNVVVANHAFREVGVDVAIGLGGSGDLGDVERRRRLPGIVAPICAPLDVVTVAVGVRRVVGPSHVDLARADAGGDDVARDRSCRVDAEAGDARVRVLGVAPGAFRAGDADGDVGDRDVLVGDVVGGDVVGAVGPGPGGEGERGRRGGHVGREGDRGSNRRVHRLAVGDRDGEGVGSDVGVGDHGQARGDAGDRRVLRVDAEAAAFVAVLDVAAGVQGPLDLDVDRGDVDVRVGHVELGDELGVAEPVARGVVVGERGVNVRLEARVVGLEGDLRARVAGAVGHRLGVVDGDVERGRADAGVRHHRHVGRHALDARRGRDGVDAEHVGRRVGDLGPAGRVVRPGDRDVDVRDVDRGRQDVVVGLERVIVDPELVELGERGRRVVQVVVVAQAHGRRVADVHRFVETKGQPDGERRAGVVGGDHRFLGRHADDRVDRRRLVRRGGKKGTFYFITHNRHFGRHRFAILPKVECPLFSLTIFPRMSISVRVPRIPWVGAAKLILMSAEPRKTNRWWPCPPHLATVTPAPMALASRARS